MQHTSSSLIRGAIFVRDLDRATRFYQALGFDEIYHEEIMDSDSAAGVMSLPPGSSCRARILKPHGRPGFGMVGLFEISNPAPKALPDGAQSPRVGEVALVFYLKDLDATLNTARQHGATWIGTPIVFNAGHRTQREVCLRDPDGVLLNFLERDPAEQDLTTTVRERYGAYYAEPAED